MKKHQKIIYDKLYYVIDQCGGSLVVSNNKVPYIKFDNGLSTCYFKNRDVWCVWANFGQEKIATLGSTEECISYFKEVLDEI